MCGLVRIRQVFSISSSLNHGYLKSISQPQSSPGQAVTINSNEKYRRVPVWRGQKAEFHLCGSLIVHSPDVHCKAVGTRGHVHGRDRRPFHDASSNGHYLAAISLISVAMLARDTFDDLDFVRRKLHMKACQVVPHMLRARRARKREHSNITRKSENKLCR